MVTKNSTRKDSSSNPLVGGILFFQPSLKPRVVTVQAWFERGCPSGVYVYDELWALVAHKIPIVDAVETRGFWVRLRTVLPLQEWAGEATLLHKQCKVKRASTLDLSFGLVIQQEGSAKIGTRDIIC